MAHANHLFLGITHSGCKYIIDIHYLTIQIKTNDGQTSLDGLNNQIISDRIFLQRL
ncbi:hypothetical protein D1872_295060 [compost metagenome]